MHQDSVQAELPRAHLFRAPCHPFCVRQRGMSRHTLAGSRLTGSQSVRIPQPIPAKTTTLQSRLRHRPLPFRELSLHSAHERRQTQPIHTGARKRGCALAPLPAVGGDLQAQLIHKELHDIITLPMELQGSPVILWGPLGTKEGQ